MKTPASKSLHYQDTGVSIDAGNYLVTKIKSISQSTHRSGVVSSIGGFCSLFEPDWKKYKQPLLVSATDGVGTKLKLAIELQQHDTIGIDLVAMCANDLIVCGAEPLYFLDYYATAQLETEVATAVIAGIGSGCQQAGIALVGGETAEMPGMYSAKDYDLAGFCVGMVDKSKLIDGQQVKPGQQIIGIASSGVHANGYSLIRHILKRDKIDLQQPFDGKKRLQDVLLTPTQIYVKPVLEVLSHYPVAALAHITGGGFYENIPRVLPANICATVDSTCWHRPKLFDWLAECGPVSPTEMLRTFNCGIGMVLILDAKWVEPSIQLLAQHSLDAWVIGHTATRTHDTNPQIIIEG